MIKEPLEIFSNIDIIDLRFGPYVTIYTMEELDKELTSRGFTLESIKEDFPEYFI